MTYRVGDEYRSIARMKNGLPVYESSKIASLSPPSGDPEVLWLENKQRIDLVGPERKKA